MPTAAKHGKLIVVQRPASDAEAAKAPRWEQAGVTSIEVREGWLYGLHAGRAVLAVPASEVGLAYIEPG